ncbi:MAG: type IV pilus modification PilV family protein [Armatimonadota bacterium]
MRRTLIYKRGGFTLVDVLFGIVITAVGLMALSYLLALPTTLNRDSHYNMLAYRAARQQIELIRQQYRNSLPPTVTDAVFTNNSIAALPNGSGRMSIANYGGSPNIRQISATVTWTDPAAPQGVRSITVTTLLTRMVQ